ncbi:hypothetical protein Tco_1451634 [Tanacetum coccineum]
MLEEESRLKMLLKQSDPMVLEKKVNIEPINYAKLNQLSEDFGKRFVPQQELSDEQAFRLQTSHLNTDQSASSLVKIKIASLMDTTVHHEELGSQTSSLNTVLITAVPAIISIFTTTIPPPPPFFNPLLQQATPTLTPTTSEATTSFPSLPDFSSVFKFNDSVTNLEKDLSKIKQVDQYAQALSSIHAIVDLSDFATPVIEKNVTESLEVAVLARSSSQPKSTYEAAASLSEFKLTKILIDKMEKNKSYDKSNYKMELYDALVKSYQTNKDLFDTYGEVFTLKRSRDDRDKDQDPSAGSDQGTKRRKSSKEAESSRDSSHTLDDSGVQHDQEFNTSNNDEQPADKEVSKDDCQVARAKEPRTLFDELMDISFDFSAFVLNWLNIKDLTQEILVGPAFELLKGTCKILIELEYHIEECSKAKTERLDWHNPEGKPHPFDLSKPLLLIPDHQGRQVIPQDFFINNDLEYLKGRYLSRRYSTSVTKINPATYEIKWIEDLVQNL